MPLIEFELDGGRIKATQTSEEFVPTQLDLVVGQHVAAGLVTEAQLAVARDARRLKFYQWALECPEALDVLLDEIDFRVGDPALVTVGEGQYTATEK